jgi:hypothetical protein
MVFTCWSSKETAHGRRWSVPWRYKCKRKTSTSRVKLLNFSAISIFFSDVRGIFCPPVHVRRTASWFSSQESFLNLLAIYSNNFIIASISLIPSSSLRHSTRISSDCSEKTYFLFCLHFSQMRAMLPTLPTAINCCFFISLIVHLIDKWGFRGFDGGDISSRGLLVLC